MLLRDIEKQREELISIYDAKLQEHTQNVQDQFQNKLQVNS